jgi:hypothetical protein
MIKEGSELWNYLSVYQRVLVGDGAFLLEDAKLHRDQEPTDYSYLVFPFAKLYEGFLKDLFLDLDIIDERDYNSDHYRIGKALSPHMVRRLGRNSAYGEVESRYSKDLASRMWHTWKNGRNLVFHYFPHNYRALSLEQATNLIVLLADTMTAAVEETHVSRKNRTTDVLLHSGN